MVYPDIRYLCKKFKKNLAFTLAEVLIVLGIIGIIAELTVPELVNDTQKNVTINILKEDYSIINQVLYRAALDSGSDVPSLFQYTPVPVADSYESIITNFVTTNVIPYIKIARNCGFVTVSSCMGDNQYFRNGSITPDSAMSKYIIFLNNGSSLVFIPDNYLGYWTRMIIDVDINGAKKPNMFGKDIFEMRYTGSDNKFLFYGNSNSRAVLLNGESNSCNTSSTGMYCGALIMQDGWQIKDDYPW